jgi:NitT/TauT family transport system substrate-binding protein
VFRRILRANGLAADVDVKLGFSLAYPEIAQALIAGRVTLALLPEPFATMAVLGKPTLTQVCDVQAEWARAGGSATYPMTLLVVDERFAAENPGAIRTVAQAYRASLEWAVAHPAEAGLLVEKHGLGVKASVAAVAIPKSAYDFTPAAAARPSIEALLRAFLEASPASIGGRLPPDSFYLDLF